jgi:hypothetical protein
MVEPVATAGSAADPQDDPPTIGLDRKSLQAPQRDLVTNGVRVARASAPPGPLAGSSHLLSRDRCRSAVADPARSGAAGGASLAGA